MPISMTPHMLSDFWMFDVTVAGKADELTRELQAAHSLG
jgi:hypothetical protein